MGVESRQFQYCFVEIQIYIIDKELNTEFKRSQCYAIFKPQNYEYEYL